MCITIVCVLLRLQRDVGCLRVPPIPLSAQDQSVALCSRAGLHSLFCTLNAANSSCTILLLRYLCDFTHIYQAQHLQLAVVTSSGYPHVMLTQPDPP